VGWVGPGDGILVYDYQGDGKVTNIDEVALVFHSPSATTDLEAMRLTFDTNHDGVFDSRDTQYDKFGVWQDKNSNGISDAGEYQTLTKMGILSINMNSDLHVEKIEGNTVNGYTSYQTTDGASHLAADVTLNVSPASTSMSVGTNVEDILGGNSILDFSSLPQVTAPLPPLASDYTNVVTITGPSETTTSATEAAFSASTIDTQAITQQLEQQHQETPLS
jgi:hypothetical protein